MRRKFVLGITGASGAAYATRLLDALAGSGDDLDFSISPAGASVFKQELGIELDLDAFRVADLLPARGEFETAPAFARYRRLCDRPRFVDTPRVADETAGSPGRGETRYFHYRDLFAPMASGSALSDGMVICPCSGGTLGAIATGASGNLIQRAAEVHLKERRKLILVPRETPLSLIQIENFRRCAEAGAVILPAAPGWYHGVDSLADLIDFVVGRILDQLGIHAKLTRRWGD